MTAAQRSNLRILVADDHRLMLAAVRRALARSQDVEIVAEVEDATKILPAIGHMKPNVVLLDLRMPLLDGLTCLERVRSHYPDVAVVVLSAFASEEDVAAARARGASGYVVKTVDPLRLAAMIAEAVRSPEFVVFRPVLPEVDHGGDDSHSLSERELAILRALTRGLTNRDIGSRLFVSEQTVKFHLRRIYRKLEVTNRTEAARYAISRGLTSRGQPVAGS